MPTHTQREEEPQWQGEDYARLVDRLWLKYALDRPVALLILIATTPLFLVIALFIKLDGIVNRRNRGPVFYREPRVSAGRVFQIIKFRTALMEDVRWIREDPDNRSTHNTRLTWTGRIILRWFLDELPQLINIVRGEMSLVGPRPHILSQHEGEIRMGLLYRDYLKGGLLGVPQACKNLRGYKEAFDRMARTYSPDIAALNTLDGLYVKKCMQSSSWGILLFDLTLIWKGLVVVANGTPPPKDTIRR